MAIDTIRFIAVGVQIFKRLGEGTGLARLPARRFACWRPTKWRWQPTKWNGAIIKRLLHHP